MSELAQKLLLHSPSFILVSCTMKQLISKLEAFFLVMTLVEDCQFKRGLQIRPKSVNPAAGKFPI